LLADHWSVSREPAPLLLAGLAAHPLLDARNLRIPTTAGLRNRYEINAAEVAAMATNGIDRIVGEGELAKGVCTGHTRLYIRTAKGNSLARQTE
jgi:hypothetical protein